MQESPKDKLDRLRREVVEAEKAEAASAKAAPETGVQVRAIRVRLTLPETSVGIKGFDIDIFKALTGTTIEEILSSLLFAPVEHELAPTACATYPLQLPPNEGAQIPIGTWGNLGFRNDNGVLVLTVPRSVWPGVNQALGDAIEKAVHIAPDVHARVKLVPGHKYRGQLGSFGAFGVEVV